MRIGIWFFQSIAIPPRMITERLYWFRNEGFAVCITYADRREDASFHESVLDAVEDYHSSVLAHSGLGLRFCPFASMANRWKCWRALSR